MSNRLISVIMLVVLVLQGIGVAAADVAPEDSSHLSAHCEGNEDAGSECACCNDADTTGLSCASQCSVAALLSAMCFVTAIEKSMGIPPVSELYISGPSYLPINPPPIS